MADSEGNFGGDGSVTWKLRIANAKGGSVVQVPANHTGGPVNHDGEDTSVRDVNFRISLRIPQDPADRATLQGTLTTAAGDVGAGTPGTWTREILLVVEDYQSGKKPTGLPDEQVRVVWQST